MKSKNKKENPQPDRSIPGSGQHQPDISDEKSKSKRGNKPLQRDGMFPEEVTGDDPKEFNDGEPVEEKSPRLPNNL